MENFLHILRRVLSCLILPGSSTNAIKVPLTIVTFYNLLIVSNENFWHSTKNYGTLKIDKIINLTMLLLAKRNMSYCEYYWNVKSVHKDETQIKLCRYVIISNNKEIFNYFAFISLIKIANGCNFRIYGIYGMKAFVIIAKICFILWLSTNRTSENFYSWN